MTDYRDNQQLFQLRRYATIAGAQTCVSEWLCIRAPSPTAAAILAAYYYGGRPEEWTAEKVIG